MNDKLSAQEFRASLDRSLSGLKADPGLARRILSLEKGEKPMKKKLSASLALILALLLGLTAAAFAATALCRVVNWQGEVTRTAEPPQISSPQPESAADREALDDFISEIPDAETAFAWYADEDGGIQSSALHKTQAQFSAVDPFLHALTGAEQLTAPAGLPREEMAECTARIYTECRAFGQYTLLKSSASGRLRYNRFLIDASSAVATGYELTLATADGSLFSIRSELRESASPEPLMLREGETAQKAAVPGMDEALLITAADDAYPDGLILQRRLLEPVRLKQLPLNDRLLEADDRCYAYEYVTVWGYRLTEPERLLRIWGGE